MTTKASFRTTGLAALVIAGGLALAGMEAGVGPHHLHQHHGRRQLQRVLGRR